MPEYNTKSMEELRWEDYSSGCKGNTGGAAHWGFGSVATNSFGATTAASPFGGAATPAVSSPFGVIAQPAFGTSTPTFGAAATSSLFGAHSTPAFGSQRQQQQPAFYAATTPAFGPSMPPTAARSAPHGVDRNAPLDMGLFGAPEEPHQVRQHQQQQQQHEHEHRHMQQLPSPPSPSPAPQPPSPPHALPANSLPFLPSAVIRRRQGRQQQPPQRPPPPWRLPALPQWRRRSASTGRGIR